MIKRHQPTTGTPMLTMDQIVGLQRVIKRTKQASRDEALMVPDNIAQANDPYGECNEPSLDTHIDVSNTKSDMIILEQPSKTQSNAYNSQCKERQKYLNNLKKITPNPKIPIPMKEFQINSAQRNTV
jgi:hypothetical protein